MYKDLKLDSSDMLIYFQLYFDELNNYETIKE